jgi:hypothetical protein
LEMSLFLNISLARLVSSDSISSEPKGTTCTYQTQ